MKERFRFRSFAAFRRVYASGVGFSWFLFFLCTNAYLWLFLKNPQTGSSPFWITLEYVAGSSFFLGFIVFVGGTVQARRAFHADRFVIIEADEEQLGAYRQTKRQRKFAAPLFVRAVWAGTGFAVFHGGVSALLAHFFSPEGISAGWFVFGLAAYLSMAAAGLSVAAAWVSIARMRRWQQDGRRAEFGFFRYTFLQNALAALIVNVPLGFLFGHLKFPGLAEQVAEIRGGAPHIPPLALALDLGVSVLIIAALFGAAIRTKVAVELMSEIAIRDGGAVRGRHGRWVGWYAPILGVVAFGLAWLLGLAWPGGLMSATAATIIKCVIQGLVGLGVGYWAASRSATLILRGGAGFNPFRPSGSPPAPGEAPAEVPPAEVQPEEPPDEPPKEPLDS